MLSLILHAAIMAAIRTDTLLQIHDGCISISIAIRVWGDNGIDNPILKKGKKKNLASPSAPRVQYPALREVLSPFTVLI